MGKDSTAGATPLTPHPWTLYLGNCLPGLRELPSGSVDVFLTDPPYSEHTHDKVRRGGSFHAPDVTTGGPKRPVISTSVVLGFVSLTPWLRRSVAREMARLVRRWVVIFSDAESVHAWKGDLEAAGLEHVRIGAWEKIGGTPQFTGDRPGIGFEALEIAHPAGRKRWNGGGRHGLWRCLIAGGERSHPTQKPDRLMEDLVRDFSDPDELVCDPFAGSGTTGVACLRLGRRFLGWERDAAFHAAAASRLRATAEWWRAPGRRRRVGPRPAAAVQQGLGFTSVEAPQAPK